MTLSLSTNLDLKKLFDLAYQPFQLELSEESVLKIRANRDYLDKVLASSDKLIYGINTGFGALHNHVISKADINRLQENLVLSHACGMGKEVPNEVVQWMLLLKIQSLGLGYSGVHLQTVQHLVELYNAGVSPIIFTQGSLGASGDLAPLAHLSLPLLGRGMVFYKGKRQGASSVLEQLNLKPLTLSAKEGLALLNGTQFMTAYGVQVLMKSIRLSYLADLIAALSMEGFMTHQSPFHQALHLIRPHNGQIKTAARIREFLEDSPLMTLPREGVQDPYSFRCVPQVHGATKDALDYVSKVIITEINSVTDNPTVFESLDEVLSGGNFHGQPLALALDHLKIAMAELGNISERRTFQLLSGARGLPLFLVNQPGLNSGLMITQYTAASIVSTNKQLASPASVDSITSSNGQEDHVSMGANAAVQAYDLVNNVETILAIELLCASQALYFRNENCSEFVQSFLNSFRDHVGFIEQDALMHDHLKEAVKFIQSVQIDTDLLLE
ncbi:MAG: histidine ammonia-lyase [Flavobacteriaceae bacterium]|nr:histidine ammonia-lyase [Flavobacteriaceae bacterium]